MSAGLLLLFTKPIGSRWRIQHEIDTCQKYVRGISFTADELFVGTAGCHQDIMFWNSVTGCKFESNLFHLQDDCLRRAQLMASKPVQLSRHAKITMYLSAVQAQDPSQK
jgi:hypothetical protein